MTDPIPDFDAEKRRRIYAAVLGAAGASTLAAVIFIKFAMSGEIQRGEEPLWELALVIFGFWLFFFVLKFVAAYALWFRPYTSRKRAVLLSVCAVLVVYLCLFGAALFFTTLNARSFDFTGSIRAFLSMHIFIYGLPYFAAAIVGWCFARPVPDVRQNF